MEYTRYSSQPATVDLVRADLAEFWTIDDSEVQSPQRPPSVSGVSDMLDLEFLPTPRLHPSKPMKKDPLADILGDLLDLSPSPKRGRNGHQTKSDSDKEMSEQDQDEAVANDQPRKRSTRDSAKSSEIDSPPRPTQQPGHSSHPKPPPAKANKRKRPSQPAPTAEQPLNSPVRKPRPQRQSNAKTTASSAKQRGPAKVSKQPKTLPEATNAASTRTKPKGRKRDDDPFELSDWTDTEAEERPKKRQAKKPSPSRPPARSARKAQADKGGDAPVSQKSKPTRAPKKPSGRVAPHEKKVDAEPTYLDTTTHAEEEEELDNDMYQNEDEETSVMAKPKSNEETQMDHPVSTIQEEDSPEMFASPEPRKCSPIAMGESKAVLPLAAKSRDVIILSSESPEPNVALAASTSPMFVEQDQKHVAASVAPAINLPINTESDDQRVVAGIVPAIDHSLNSESSDQRSPIRLPVTRRRSGFTPPPSFQPRALRNNAEIPQRHNIDHALPTSVRDAFFCDEQPAAVSPPPVPELESCSEEESLSPEEIWKQAVEDDSPPAVLHRIVNLLHRSLKPREEIVRDIAADYRENALRLLDNLDTRHDQERSDTLFAIRKTSRAAFSVFSGAGQDVAILINGLRDMDVARTADALTRPALAEKLGAVARLCQMKLSSYVRKGQVEDDEGSELEDNLDGLADTYRLKLIGAVRRSDDRTLGDSSEVDSQVEEFIQRCLDGESRKTRYTETRKPEKRSARNADEALEVFLDGILNKLQENKDGANFDGAVALNAINVVSEGSVMADMDLLD